MRVALGLTIAAAPGCGVLCDGPGCEASFPAARLSTLRGAIAAGEADVWADADARFDGADEDGAGWTVGASQGRIVVGMPDASRVARIRDRDGVRDLDPDATWSAAGTTFGTSVLVVPAVDGGGAFDLWVGAPGQDYGRGAAYLFRDADADSGKTTVADVAFVSVTPNDRLGTSLFRCADLTGDRLPEIAVTAPWFEAPSDWDVDVPTLSGAVFLLLSEELAGVRDPDVKPWDVGRAWWGAVPGEGAGTSVVCDEDLDGDGLADVVIGAPWADESRGRVYVHLSGDAPAPSGPLDGVGWTALLGPEGGEWFGSALETLAVEGETMLAVGAAGYDDGGGRVHLLGGAELAGAEPVARAIFQTVGRDQPDHFGRWVYAGDVDGDQLDDLIVGAPDWHGAGRNAFDTGQLWIWFGANAETWNLRTTDADATIVGTEPFQRIGRAVAVVDVDLDGIDDLLIPTRSEGRGSAPP